MKKIRDKKSVFLWMLVYILIILLALFTCLPLVYLISTSFKPMSELYLFPPTFFVRNPTLDNFSTLLTSLSSSAVPFLRYIFNSLFITVIIVIGTVFACTMGAYALVKHHPPGSKLFFNFVVAALMFSPYVTQIPRFIIVNGIGLNNSILAVILPAIASAYNFFLMKQFIEQLPDTMIEAARIDGAGEFYIYRKIIMPMLSPAWSTLIVFSFVNSWNDFFSPLIYINDEAMKTLPLALNTIASGGSGIGRAGAVAASAMVMTLPTVIVFTIAQRKVMQTMMYSGIKG